MHVEFMAFVTDEGSYDAARAAAQARGYPMAVVQQGGMDLLGDMLENNAPPKILLLDLDGQGDVLLAAQRAINLVGPDCKLIFVGGKNDVGLYRQFLQMGVMDYIVKPLLPESVVQAVINAGKLLAGDKPINTEDRVGKLVPVIGVRGGAGASTVAVNLAWIFAHKLNLYTGLMDLDVHFGTTALALDKEPGTGMRAALENTERLDGLLIASSMVQESERLSLLCTEENLETPLVFDGEAAAALLRPVAKDFDIILADLPRMLLTSQKRLIAEAGGIILVSDMTLVALRDIRRIRHFLKMQRPDLLPIIVVNRTGEAATATIDQATFEKNLEAKIDFILPEDTKAARAAANLGKAIAEIAPESAMTRTLTALARVIGGIKEPQAKATEGKSLLKGLFGARGAKDAKAEKDGKDIKAPAKPATT